MSEKKHDIAHVVAVRDWKEYLGESLLIIFSVSLALILTEVFTKIHEDQQTKEVIHQLRDELINNKRLEQEQYQYHLQVLKNIDSALAIPEFSKQFISNGEIHLSKLAPHGAMLHDLNDVAWQVAKQNNIFSKIDFPTYVLLNDIYNNQERITKSEQEIAKVLLSRESRTAADNRITLILLHDNYHGWDVDRVPNLLDLYQQAIDKLEKY
jgi:hypothetical protein